MILVAGGTGRLGSHVVRELVGRDERVRVLARDPDRAAGLSGLGAELVAADVRDAAAVHRAATGADTVISLVQGFVGAGNVSPASVDRDGNRNLIDAAATQGADVVLMSMVGAAADSPFELGRMKWAAEKHLRARGVAGVVVRATLFAELWLELMRGTARSGRVLVFGRGENPVNFVSVRDVAALVVAAWADADSRGSALEIGGPDDLTFNELAGLVQHADGFDGEPRHVPRAAMRAAVATVGRLRPSIGRQLRSALLLDTVPLRFESANARERYPETPCTSVAALLG